MSKPKSLEETLAQAKVLILKEYFKEYADYLEKASNYAEIDPPAALLKLRQLLELVSHELWQSKNSVTPPSIFEVFGHDSIKEEIPKSVMHRIHSLRILSNEAIHNQPTTYADVLLCIEHLYVLLDWFGKTYKNLTNLPVPVPPTLSFGQYLLKMIKSLGMWVLVLSIGAMGVVLFRLHRILPVDIGGLHRTVYEGIFENGTASISGLVVSASYSLVLICISSVLSWLIFRGFRNQGFRAMAASFVLMYTMVFSMQYLVLLIADKYTTLY